MTSGASPAAEGGALIVTVAGRPGSGKSTVAKALAKRLGMDHASSGDFMRQMAAERDMTVLELSQAAELDASIDREIDDRTARMGRDRTNFVMDSRLAWHFIPHSVKVFLEVRPEVAAERIFGDRRAGERENVDLEATIASTKARAASEAKRYSDYYGIDYLDHANYDIIVDTSDRGVAEIVEMIAAQVTAP